MTSFIDLMASDVWSDADITNRERALNNSVVSAERQDQLRNIMIGHMAGMRPATPDELAEVGLVKATQESNALLGAAARADMVLLQSALDAEAATHRLAQAPADPPTEDDDAQRQAAQAVLDGAAPEVQALVAQRAAAWAVEPAQEGAT